MSTFKSMRGYFYRWIGAMSFPMIFIVFGHYGPLWLSISIASAFCAYIALGESPDERSATNH